MSAKAAAAAQVIKATEDAEALAHDIMSQRQQMVDCDAKRHKNMEALAQFRKNAIGEKAWTCCGPFFLQLPSAQVKSMIEKDQTEIAQEIADLRSSIKKDMAALQEYRPSDMDSGLVQFVLREQPAPEKKKD